MSIDSSMMCYTLTNRGKQHMDTPSQMAYLLACITARGLKY